MTSAITNTPGRDSGQIKINWANPITRNLIFDSGADFRHTGYWTRDTTSTPRFVDTGQATLRPRKGAFLRVTSVQDYIRFCRHALNSVDFVSVAAGSDWSYFGLVREADFTTGNPGHWRSGGGSAGNTYVIFLGTNLRIELNGTNFDSTSGRPTVGTTYTIGASIQSGSHVDGWLNTTKVINSATAVTTPAFTVRNAGYQSSTAEMCGGLWVHFMFWNRAISETEYLALNFNHEQTWKYRTSRRSFGGSSVPVGSGHRWFLTG